MGHANVQDQAASLRWIVAREEANGVRKSLALQADGSHEQCQAVAQRVFVVNDEYSAE